MSRSRHAFELALALCLPAVLAVAMDSASAVGDTAVASHVVPAATTSGAAYAARAKSSRCSRLRGRDRAPARLVKLVKRSNADNGTDLLGCVLPRGRVYTVASSAHGGTYGQSYRLRQVANAIVLVSISSSDQYGSGRSTFVQDLRSGRRYKIALACSQLFESCDGNATAPAAFVNSRGQAAAAIVPEAGNAVVITGFSRRGEAQQLDSGPPEQLPPSSLRLHGSMAAWTHAGEARSAQLPGS